MDICLRKVKENDLEKIMNWRMQPFITKYMYTDPQLTMEDQKRWYEAIQKNDCKYWVICCDRHDIGLFYFYKIDYVNLRGDWGCYIAEQDFNGKGIGKLLLCNIYDYGFNKLNLNKLCCEALEGNVKAISLYKKSGAEIEGIRKEHVIKNGEKLTIVEMAILRSKWDVFRKKLCYEHIVIED